MKRRYGDCKDKSLLLLALLQALGIQSKPVLLQFGQRRGLDKALPSPQLFNHAILQVTVDGNVFYLDPTLLGQHGQLKRMGQIHEGAQVLVVAPEARQLSTIASANARELLHSEVSETASLPKLGAEGQLQVRQIWRGVVAERLRVMHERVPREQIVKSIGNAMEPRYPGASLVGEPEIQDDRTNNVLSITTVYAVPKLAIEREGNWYVRFLPGNMRGALVTPPSSTRTAPLHLGSPFHAKYAFEVKFPDEVSVITDPRAETVRNKHFTYTVATSFRGTLSKTTIELRTLADQVEVADLAKYAEDLRAISNVATGAVVIPKGAIKSAKSATAAKKDFSQVLRDRLQETVDKTTETIKSGKLTGSDLAGSYCLRSSAYADLGKADKALADANEALKVAPNASASLYCRAYVYFGTGEFEKSVEDYSKAIALGAAGAKNFHQRGISRFYAGKLDEALEDFTRASDEGDLESQVYSDLWLSWTYQRLGKPLSEAVLKRAAVQPRGDWPRPALAVTTSNLAPEEMLKLLERKSGDDRRMASSEGYFYLGQYYLGRGDRSKAREFFEKTRQLNVILYTEHIAAGFELQRLVGSIEAAAPQLKAPDAKKTVQKTPRKAPEAWTDNVWKRQ